MIAHSVGSGTTTPYSYGPYGEPSDWTGSRLRYTGQIMLPEVQLYHYKARVYDPKHGRFLQTDPIGYEDDLNLYAYVRNDPINKKDPTGKSWEQATRLRRHNEDEMSNARQRIEQNVAEAESRMSSRLGSGAQESPQGSAASVSGAVAEGAGEMESGRIPGAGAEYKLAGRWLRRLFTGGAVAADAYQESRSGNAADWDVKAVGVGTRLAAGSAVGAAVASFAGPRTGIAAGVGFGVVVGQALDDSARSGYVQATDVAADSGSYVDRVVDRITFTILRLTTPYLE